jgi:Leucine-rich repeat (LRR) protein
LSDNKIKNISELINLSNLLFINLNDNNISDISILLKNKKIKSVYINGNIINYNKIDNINKYNLLYDFIKSNRIIYKDTEYIFNILSEIKNITD